MCFVFSRVCSGGHDPATVKYSELRQAAMAGGDEAVELTLVDALEGAEGAEGADPDPTRDPDPESGGRLPDLVAATKMLAASTDECASLEAKETYFSIAIQVFIPFLIAGFGTVGAGLVLDVVQVTFYYRYQKS